MFFDVFPTLEVNGDMKKLLSETEVTKVGMNHEKDHIRIYLNGTRLIHKKNIYQLEKNIHDISRCISNAFGRTNLPASILRRFRWIF